MSKMFDQFDFDHLPIGKLSLDQHLVGAVSFFQKAIRLYPRDGLEIAKHLQWEILKTSGFSDEDCKAIIMNAVKQAIERELT